MEYRILPHGGEKIGVIGMGSSVVGAQKEADIIRTVRTAFDLGVNYFDMAGGHASIFPAYGKTLKDIRRQVFLQVHFGADYTTGEYGWTTELDEIKRSVAWQLENLQTDYIDFGFIHCLDEEADLRTYEKNGILRYLQDLQRQGVVRHLGLSSHAPRLAKRSASPMRSTSPAFSPSFPATAANRSCARSFPILKRLRRSATMPKLPRLQLPPRSAPASTASTAIRVLPDSTLR